MPSFANPFNANVQRKVSKEELIQAIRLDIAGELEAIYLYDAHVMATDDAVAKAVLSDIRDEEEAEHFESGELEVKELMEELGIKEPKLSGLTVGSLKNK